MKSVVTLSPSQEDLAKVTTLFLAGKLLLIINFYRVSISHYIHCIEKINRPHLLVFQLPFPCSWCQNHKALPSCAVSALPCSVCIASCPCCLKE